MSNTVISFERDGVTYRFAEADKMTLQELAPMVPCHYHYLLAMKRAGLPVFNGFTTLEVIRTFQLHFPDFKRGAVRSG